MPGRSRPHGTHAAPLDFALDESRRALALCRIGMFSIDTTDGPITWDDAMYELHGTTRDADPITAESSRALSLPIPGASRERST